MIKIFREFSLLFISSNCYLRIYPFNIFMGYSGEILRGHSKFFTPINMTTRTSIYALLKINGVD